VRALPLSIALAAAALASRVALADDPLATRAVSADPEVAADAVRALRAKGPAGLAELLAAHEAALASLDPASEEGRRLVRAVDAVAGQRDARFARLFWHTDLDEALARARAERRPVLSLRLLGRLDEERSCANSRFFRTVLYPDPAVARELSEHFVLHWRSVRPVPVVTVDFGDGRVIERTFTGNSAHYVLDSRGRVVDAIPGLVAPVAFVRALEAARAEADAVAGLEDAPRAAHVAAWHARALREQESAWAADLSAAGIAAPAGGVGSGLSDEGWAAVARLHAADARLSPESVRVMETKTNAVAVMPVAVSKALVETPLARAVRRFQRSVAEDSVRNEYGPRRAVRARLAASPEADVERLNEWVYAEVFLTPSSDPWLGLVPPDEYAALDGGGLRVR
jgi:hypothetical protein